jgi:transcriptional regulator with XRE-family HTH domain
LSSAILQIDKASFWIYSHGVPKEGEMKPGKIIVRARQARLNHQAKLGRSVTQLEAATAMGMDPSMLNRIEKGKTSGADWETLARLCAYYGIGICELLEYTEDDSRISAEESEEGPEGEEPVTASTFPTGPSSFVRRSSPVLVR